MLADPGVLSAGSSGDEWSRWLLNRRHGGDAAQAARVREAVDGYVERVLDGAALAPGMAMAMADIGTGEGVVAWRAIERTGPGLRVVLTDVSAPLLAHARARAQALGVAAQCRFVECGAERLEGIESASLDAVTSRAALAYVADKPAAMAEIFRVLKPGGRVSLAEPVFRDEAQAACAMGILLQHERPADALLPLLHKWKAAQFPDTEAAMAASPIANYSERDLLRLAQKAGFTTLHMELHMDVRPNAITDWAVFCAIAPHPWAPGLGEIMATRFTPEERRTLEAALRPEVEAGRLSTASRMVFLSAIKPTG
jgi:ubiquinone/menaquinone biosynthesis C-methylase UbiE